MYGGEGDESEPASLSAPVVMSFSKTSLIFNGARLQEREENRSARTARTHTNTHTLVCAHTGMHTQETVTYADNAENYRLTQSAPACTHACTPLLRCKQGSLRS